MYIDAKALRKCFHILYDNGVLKTKNSKLFDKQVCHKNACFKRLRRKYVTYTTRKSATTALS